TPLAAATIRPGPTRPGTQPGRARQRPLPPDGLLTHRLDESARGARSGPRAVAAAGVVRHDDFRTGGVGGAAAGGSRLPFRVGLLGRVRSGRLRLGHALATLPAPEKRADAGP